MTDWVKNGDSGSSVRAKINSIPNDGSVFKGFPLPFFGLAASNGWIRPSLTTFSEWINQGGYFFTALGNSDQAVVPGSGYAPGDLSTLAGGATLSPAKVQITDTQAVSASLVSAGSGGAGVIATSSLGVGGSGYAPGDTGTIQVGNGDATYQVNTVDGSGAVLTFALTGDGTNYVIQTDAVTNVSTGGGDGNFTINIDSIVPYATQVTGTTGTTTGPGLFVLDVLVGAAGAITSITDVATAGDYTTNPTDVGNEPVTDNAGFVTGAVVHVLMGALAGELSRVGCFTSSPANPVAESSSTGGGSGATWDITTTAFNLSSATDNAGGLPLIISGRPPNLAGASFNSMLQAIMKPIGAAPWTVTVAAAGIENDGGSRQAGIWAPIVLYNSAQDKAIALTWWYSGVCHIDHYGSTDPLATPTDQIGNNNIGFTLPSYFQWFRVINDGVNLTYQIGFEGQLFLTIFEESATALAPSFDKVGFGMELQGIRINVANPLCQQATAMWDWTD